MHQPITDADAGTDLAGPMVPARYHVALTLDGSRDLEYIPIGMHQPMRWAPDRRTESAK